jgi:septal ring factor EnvC (AmiA/AmiB activator)
MDEKEIKDLLAEARNEIPSRVYHYLLIGISIVVLFLSLTGGYFLYTTTQDYKKNLEFYQNKIESYDKQIAENNKKLEDLEKERKELMKDVDDYKKKYDDISYNYSKLINQVNKPLSQPEQDKVFYSLGYNESYYQPDGGRRFSAGNTVKLQVELTERMQFKDQRDTLLLTNDTLNKVLLTDINTINTYQDTIKNFDNKEVEYKAEIKTLRNSAKKEKYKKFLIGLGIGILGGYTGAQIAHH